MAPEKMAPEKMAPEKMAPGKKVIFNYNWVCLK